jgi:hypothetical protein
MDRSNFQKILTLIDTIHDYKSSDRGNLDTEEDKMRMHFHNFLINKIIDEISGQGRVLNYNNNVPIPRGNINEEEKVRGAAIAKAVAKKEQCDKYENDTNMFGKNWMKCYNEKRSIIIPNIKKNFTKGVIAYNMRTLVNECFNIDYENVGLPTYIIQYIDSTSDVRYNASQSADEKENSTLFEVLRLLDTKQKPYNPANILEMIMLTLLHNDFRDAMGLSSKQNYIKSISNCNNRDKLRLNSNGNVNATVKDFCEKIYAKTYDSDSLFKVFGNLEENIVDITKMYLKIPKAITIDTFSQTENILDYAFYYKICLGTPGVTWDSTSIYSFNKEDQRTRFIDLIKRLFDTMQVKFVCDSNGLVNEWKNGNVYEGLFTRYDSFVQSFDMSGGMPPPPKKTIVKKEIVKTENIKEFQQYQLSKEKNELLLFDKLFIANDGSQFKVYIDKDGDIDDIKTEKRSQGLPIFLKLFDEINKKTLGYKTLSNSPLIKEQLKNSLQQIGLKHIKELYKITLKDIDDDASMIQLSKEDFIKALFDLKRSMDYLYVKACCTANMREKLEANKRINAGYVKNSNVLNRSNSSKQQTKYIFVSLDKSAICYSLLLNNPCIMTTTEGGERYIHVFNPPEIYHNYDEILDEEKYKTSQAQNVVPQIIELPSTSSKFNTEDKIFIEFQNKLKSITFDIPIFIKINGEELKLEDCDNWTKSDTTKIGRLKAKICSEYKRDKASKAQDIRGGSLQQTQQNNSQINIQSQIRKYNTQLNTLISNNSNVSKRRYAKLVEEQIPLIDIETIAEFGSPFYIFLHFYSQLSPSIEFFWFVTFKTIFFDIFGDDMDKIDCKRYEELNKMNNISSQLQTIKQGRIQVKSATTNNIRSQNNSSNKELVRSFSTLQNPSKSINTQSANIRNKQQSITNGGNSKRNKKVPNQV